MGPMSSRPAVVVLVAILGGLLWLFLKETYWAIAMETAIERFADWLGMSRPAMVAAATPYVLALAAASTVVWAAYSVGARDRHLKPEFEFVFSQTDPRFVRNESERTIYSVGLHITAQRTIDWPSVRAHEGPFTNRVIASAHPGIAAPPGYVGICEGGALDPEVTQIIELFDLPRYENLNRRDEKDLLGRAHNFTLEARGRDARPVIAMFEYDPRNVPMVRRLS